MKQNIVSHDIEQFAYDLHNNSAFDGCDLFINLIKFDRINNISFQLLQCGDYNYVCAVMSEDLEIQNDEEKETEKFTQVGIIDKAYYIKDQINALIKYHEIIMKYENTISNNK